jgi:apolipoprotein N-acyltransferase
MKITLLSELSGLAPIGYVVMILVPIIFAISSYFLIKRIKNFKEKKRAPSILLIIVLSYICLLLGSEIIIAIFESTNSKY